MSSRVGGCAWSVPEWLLLEWGGTVHDSPPRTQKVLSSKCAVIVVKAIYRLKQAAIQFWCELLRAMWHMGFDWKTADPCLYKWDHLVGNTKSKMTLIFKCEELGKIDKYIGCKVEHNHEEWYIKLTQPVLLQNYKDDFDLDKNGLTPEM
eukprot:10733774-Ditylum_brightwellii.AAC.2